MLRAYLFLFIFTPWTFLCAVGAIIFTFFDSTGKAYHWFAKLWSRVGLFIARVKFNVEGADLVPADTPVIFMGNHQGNFDILTLFLTIPVRFNWLAKEELFKVPVFGYSLKRAGYIPLKRGDGRDALRSLDQAAQLIKGGKSVIAFPEGTRSPDGNLLPFKKGGFLLATKSGVPIVPFTINGSRKINPPPKISLHPGTINIRFFQPIQTDGIRGKEISVLMDKVKNVIESGLER
jgi:1-acyl-sn-glycerol-3-phosphate acyltransferase